MREQGSQTTGFHFLHSSVFCPLLYSDSSSRSQILSISDDKKQKSLSDKVDILSSAVILHDDNDEDDGRKKQKRARLDGNEEKEGEGEGEEKEEDKDDDALAKDEDDEDEV